MKELKFVDVGEGITEGHIRKWLVPDGTNVKEDQAIVKVETDKAIVDVPAPIGGTVKINAQENTTVHLGDVIAYIGTPADLKNFKAPASKATLTIEKGPASGNLPRQEVAPQAMASKEVIATPSVRKMIRELNLDINNITGSGPGGRIMENDVTAIASKPRTTPETSVSPSKQMFSGEVERVKLTQIRKAIAKNMEESAKIPRAAHMDLVNANALFAALNSMKKEVEQKYSTKLTLMSFIIKAAVEALKENQRVNSSYDGAAGEVIIKKYYNIGIAVDSPDGLRVVVIKNADKKNIVDLAKDLEDLHQKALNGTISIDEMRDSTFTITNVGSLGGGYLSVPMINPPEVAILGVHLLRDAAVVDNGQIKAGKILPISLSYDHRVVDGADGVRFTNSIIKRLQDPSFLKL